MLIRRTIVPVLALVAALTLPAVSGAASGGAGLGGSPAPASPNPAAPAGTVTASAGGITLTSRATALLRGRLTVTGTVGGAAGRVVEIDRRGRETGWHWRPTTSGTVGRDGSFSAVWAVDHIGRFALRALIRAGRSARDSTASPTVTVTVYRPSKATIYGPGLYGNQTACGQTLGPDTLGVASRTLPCGTPVALLYHGHVLVVPVIDRGPFTTGVDWDLTEATANALAIPGTVLLGAVSLRR